ncbi:MAG: succinylglutamate desuccinylase/aspartoacylase family protein [Saprospiraceae bacterium]|nr:succinylglutamate desuccinylase/aspartoacylase family protein [Saprospiraceae bacterium]
MLKRTLGDYTQGRRGPLLICTVGLHGNEWAGVHALTLLLEILQDELVTNPQFKFYGKLVVIAGNLPALNVKQRFVNCDLNRIWNQRNFDNPGNEVEFGEMINTKEAVDALILEWGGDNIYLLDLHTTTAEGGIFLLPTSESESIAVAQTMHAPIITGLVEKLNGTMIKHYAERKDASITGLVFEAGQHDDPLSVNRTIAATINCMRTIGCVVPEDIENRFDQLLIDYSKDLPAMARFLYGHFIAPDDEFVMNPGYRNFDPIRKGEILAHDRYGPIRSKYDGLILMPLYQTKGEDGFFLIEEI